MAVQCALCSKFFSKVVSSHEKRIFWFYDSFPSIPLLTASASALRDVELALGAVEGAEVVVRQRAEQHLLREGHLGSHTEVEEV